MSGNLVHCQAPFFYGMVKGIDLAECHAWHLIPCHFSKWCHGTKSRENPVFTGFVMIYELVSKHGIFIWDL